MVTLCLAGRREFGLSYKLWMEGWIEALVIMDSRVLEIFMGGLWRNFFVFCIYLLFLCRSCLLRCRSLKS